MRNGGENRKISTERRCLEMIKKEYHMLTIFMIWWRNKLMDNGLNEVAKEYILYRANEIETYFQKELT